MEYQDPQQELFSKLKIEIQSLGYDVYDGFLPSDGTPYPFVYLGDMTQTDDVNKSSVLGNVFQTIHVWSNTPRNRGTVSKMLASIRHVCRSMEHTKHYAWCLLHTTQRILPDNTTSAPLLHGVLELEYKLTGGI